MYVESRTISSGFYENLRLSLFLLTKTMTQVIKTITDLLLLSQLCLKYLNCVHQECWMPIFGRVVISFGLRRSTLLIYETDVCIYTVKLVVKYYNHFESPVYTYFLDISKAIRIDRVNH